MVTQRFVNVLDKFYGIQLERRTVKIHKMRDLTYTQKMPVQYFDHASAEHCTEWLVIYDLKSTGEQDDE